MAMSNSLIEIPICDLPKLRDLYKFNWPKHHIGYYTINNYIKWFEKEPNIQNIKIYSLNNDWHDGTYLIIDRYQILFCTLNESLDRLVTALCLLDTSKAYTLSGFVERVLPAVSEFIEIKGLINLVPRDEWTVWHYKPKEEALKFDVTIPKGVIIKPLSEEHAETVNKEWPHMHPGSLYFFKRFMRLSLNLGAFDEKTGELMAWCVRLQLGSLGTLQVKETYKRKGLGSLIVKHMSKMIAELGDDVCAPVIHTNTSSLNLFKKLDFKEVDKVFWAVATTDTSLIEEWEKIDDKHNSYNIE